jgi:UDP-glucose 4-epimerase
MTMAKVLLTGGAGFIGSHVADSLLSCGHQVVILDDLSGGSLENIPAGAAFVRGSVLDYDLLESQFTEHAFEYVFHLAAYAAEELSHFMKRFNYQNNLLGSVNVITLSVIHDVKCFVFTSSIAVYGGVRLPFTEDAVPVPQDPYGIAKLAVEQELRVSHSKFGLPYIIFRPHNVYGERQHIGDQYRNVVGIFMHQVMQGKPMTVIGTGEQRRAFSYVGDVAPVIARSITVPAAYGQIFNIGADEVHSVKELAREVAEAFGSSLGMRHLDHPGEADEKYSNHRKARAVLNAGAHTPLREGLARMARWAERHGTRTGKEFDFEIKKNLPPFWQPSSCAFDAPAECFDKQTRGAPGESGGGIAGETETARGS